MVLSFSVDDLEEGFLGHSEVPECVLDYELGNGFDVGLQYDGSCQAGLVPFLVPSASFRPGHCGGSGASSGEEESPEVGEADV